MDAYLGTPSLCPFINGETKGSECQALRDGIILETINKLLLSIYLLL